MRSPSPVTRTALLAAALPLFAACDGGGSGPDRLDPSEVAGVYNLCSVRFTPSNSILPVADLMQTVVDTTPPAGRPEATVSVATGVFDLVYTHQGDAFLRQLQGSVSYGSTAITLNLPDQHVVTQELLLPTPLTLTFVGGASPSLAAQTSFSYSVARADYARATGSSESGLAATIAGALSITLSAAPCP
jgi:hypothetical protein